MAKKAKDALEFLKEIGVWPKTLEEELYRKAVAHIGAELMAYRKEHGLTQEQLAELLRMSQEMVSRIERGRENLSLKRLTKIAAALTGTFRISFGVLDEISSKSTEQGIELEGLKYKFFEPKLDKLDSVLPTYEGVEAA